MNAQSKETWAAAARAGRLAIPRLIARGYIAAAVVLAAKVDEFVKRSGACVSEQDTVSRRLSVILTKLRTD